MSESKISPQFARLLRAMMLVDATSKIKTQRYQIALREIQSSDHSLIEKDRLLTHAAAESFDLESRLSYAQVDVKRKYAELNREMGAIAESGKRSSKRDLIKLELLKKQAEMPIEVFVASQLFMPASIKELRKSFPSENKELADAIKLLSKDPRYQNQHPSARHVYATVDLFANRYPSVVMDLKEQSVNPLHDEFTREISKNALSLIGNRVDSDLIRPTTDPKLNGKAGAAVLLTDSMKPMISRIGQGLRALFSPEPYAEKIKKAAELTYGWSKTALKGMVSSAIIASAVFSFDYANDYDVGVDLLVDKVMSIADTHGEKSFSSSPTVLHQELLVDSPMLTDADGGLTYSSPIIELASYDDSAADAPYNLVEDPGQSVDSMSHGWDHENAPMMHADIPSDEHVAEMTSAVYMDVPTTDLSPELSTKYPLASGGAYTVQPGDTLSEIIESQLIDAQVGFDYGKIVELWTLVAEVNGLDDPDVINEGQTITLIDIPNSELAMNMPSNEKPVDDISVSLPLVKNDQSQSMRLR